LNGGLKMKVKVTVKDMVKKRKELEKKLDQLDEFINYLSAKYDEMLDELKDLDSDLSYINVTFIQEAEENNG
jgi:uncharacterized coiled-coil DUF342 family protein